MLSLVDVPDVTTAVPLKSLITGVVKVLLVNVCVPLSVTTFTPLTWHAPVTFKLSSIVVCPLAESRFKLPATVSISLPVVTPILRLLSVDPPLTVIFPVRVELPLTLKLFKVVLPSTF